MYVVLHTQDLEWHRLSPRPSFIFILKDLNNASDEATVWHHIIETTLQCQPKRVWWTHVQSCSVAKFCSCTQACWLRKGRVYGTVSLVPRPSEGGWGKKAWYPLHAHVLHFPYNLYRKSVRTPIPTTCWQVKRSMCLKNMGWPPDLLY